VGKLCGAKKKKQVRDDQISRRFKRGGEKKEGDKTPAGGGKPEPASVTLRET